MSKLGSQRGIFSTTHPFVLFFVVCLSSSLLYLYSKPIKDEYALKTRGEQYVEEYGNTDDSGASNILSHCALFFSDNVLLVMQSYFFKTLQRMGDNQEGIVHSTVLQGSSPNPRRRVVFRLPPFFLVDSHRALSTGKLWFVLFRQTRTSYR